MRLFIGILSIVLGLYLITFNKSNKRHFGWGIMGFCCYFLFSELNISPI